MASITLNVNVPADGSWVSLGTPAAGKNMIVDTNGTTDFVEVGFAAISADLAGIVGHKVGGKERIRTFTIPGAQGFARRMGGIAGKIVPLIVTITA